MLPPPPFKFLANITVSRQYYSFDTQKRTDEVELLARGAVERDLEQRVCGDASGLIHMLEPYRVRTKRARKFQGVQKQKNGRRRNDDTISNPSNLVANQGHGGGGRAAGAGGGSAIQWNGMAENSGGGWPGGE